MFALKSHRQEVFAEDRMGVALRGPTDFALAGPRRGFLFGASLDNLVIHRFGGSGARGLELRRLAV